MSLDLARPLNRYKDFWSAAEKENPYPRDSEYLGAFIFRFVYQQLPFIIFPERIPRSFSRTRAIYIGPSERQLRICSEFEQLSGIPLDIFLGVAERLYSFFLAHPRADGGLLETHLGAVEKGHLASTLARLAVDRSRFKEICGQTQAARIAERPYEFNPLLRFPLIRQGPYLLCPYPELIVYAATRGLYFYLADECGTAFQDNFGHLFSHHAEELTAARLGKSSMLTEQDERALGWDGKTNDFTVILQDKAVLFECKTSGLFFSSKRGASLEDIRTDLKKNLANPKHRSGLFQLHDKIEAIKSGKLPPALAGKYVPIKEFFPVLLLYDQIQFANKEETMRNLLDAELKAAGISAFQFQIWHIEELENLFEIIQPSDFLRAVAEKSKDPKFSSRDLNTYLFERVRRRYLRPFFFVPKGDTPALRTLSSLADRQ